MQKTWKHEVAWPFECLYPAWETGQGLELDVKWGLGMTKALNASQGVQICHEEDGKPMIGLCFGKVSAENGLLAGRM